jgi:hypothetical protein
MLGYHKKDGINRLEDDFPNPEAIGPRWYEQNVLNLTPNSWARFNGLNGRRWLNWPMRLRLGLLAFPMSLSPNFKKHLELDTWLMWIT